MAQSRFAPRHREALAQRFQALQQRRINVMRQRLDVFFRQQSARVVARYTKTKTSTLEIPVWMGTWPAGPVSRKAMADDLLPENEDRRLQIVMQPDLLEQYIRASDLSAGLVGREPPSADDPRVQDYLLTSGERIVAINDATRDDVREALALGGERGYNQHQIARGVPHENFRGLDDIVEQTYRGRSDTIVRTELAFASASASLDTYDEADVEEVDVLDGDGCGWTDHDDPDLADGSRRTMDEAEEYPIAHPNAVFAGSTFMPYGHLQEMKGADYEGPGVQVVLSLGAHMGSVETTIGPNHPILTLRHGLVRAQELQPGQEVIYDLRAYGAATAPNLQHMPLVEEVFDALATRRGYVAIPAAAHDLHGDAVFCQGEVHVVDADGELLDEWHIPMLQQVSQFALVGADPKLAFVASTSARQQSIEAVLLAASGSMGGGGVGVIGSRHFTPAVVIAARPVTYRGRAFDASTVASLYCSDGLVVTNCVRVFLPVLYLRE